MMDEEFENLSISSSDEWAILDDKSESNLPISDKFCSICGVELDQIVFKRASCALCPVCYNCYQNYPCSKFTLQCEHTKGKPHAMEVTPLSETNGSVKVNANEAMKGNGCSQLEHNATTDKEADDFPLLRHVQQDLIDELPVSSSPRLIPTLNGLDEPISGVDAGYRRYSLSWSDGEIVSGNSTDSDVQEVVAMTAALGPSSGFNGSPASGELKAKLASFDFAPPASCGSLRCAPKPVPTIGCVGARQTGGSPPTSSFFVLGNSLTSRSPPPSPPSPTSPSNRAGSPMNSAAQFLKSVVKHSATALNNFDFLPMHPWEGVQRAPSAGVGVKGAVARTASGSAQLHRLESLVQTDRQVSATQMAADPLMLPARQQTMSDEKLRALIAPRTIPKCVFEPSAYSLR